MCARTGDLALRCCIFERLASICVAAAAATAADDDVIFALADPNNNRRWRSTIEGERLIDDYSQLEAFRYPLSERATERFVKCSWRAVFSDRYAFCMRLFEPLG